MNPLEWPDRPAWHAHAACAGMDPDLFFSERGDGYEQAVKVCRRCPVQAECLAYAMSHQEKFGMWGGVSMKGRLRIRRGRVA